MKKGIRPGIYVILAATALLWGASFVFTRSLFLEAPQLTPVFIITVRLLLATLLLLPLICLLGKWERIRSKDLKYFLLLAFFEPFLYFLFENTGVRTVSSGLSSIIISTIPLFVPFGMYMVYKEKLHWINWLGLILSMFGVYVMIFSGGETNSCTPYGLICLCCAVITAVIYSVLLVKVVNDYKPYTVTIYTNLIGLLYFLPVFFCGGHYRCLQLHFTSSMLLSLACLGIGCSVLAYILFNIGVKKVGASRASVFNNAIPIFTLIFAVSIGQEDMAVMKVVGIVLVLLGVCIAQKKPRKTAAAVYHMGDSNPRSSE